MFQWEDFKPENPADIFWDVIVIGTGMGGSTAGYALAKSNLNVLFVERGMPPDTYQQPSRWKRLKALLYPRDHEADLIARGRWPHQITIMKGHQAIHFYPPLGIGPGGSSAIYGAALERFRRVDFFKNRTTANCRNILPDEWPIDFDEFATYYAEAEKLYGICGSHDPLDVDDTSVLLPAPPLSKKDENFYESFKSLGLSPYRLHVGIAYEAGCTECQGIRCLRNCKAEASSRCLKPALMRYNASVLFGCTVERIEMAGTQAKAVVVKTSYFQTLRLRSRVVILAAGALFTPLLLLKSRSAKWPTGIGNSNDLVGRGLMFHISDIFALWPTKRVDSIGPIKTLGSRAFYAVDDQKLGSFQSLGLGNARRHQVFDFLDDCTQLLGLTKLPFRWLFLQIVALFASRLFINSALFATILEDFPYLDNRVVVDDTKPSGFYILYNKSQELIDRTALMRRLLKRALAPHRPFLLSVANNINFGHPCGTCRFGSDPSTSVLDPNNRVHGVTNLFVLDGSFFPSSGGTNPSLTIAANALRVAKIITKDHRAFERRDRTRGGSPSTS
ncbi:MAG: GMC oxidoreductase [Methylocella sp.]